MRLSRKHVEVDAVQKKKNTRWNCHLSSLPLLSYSVQSTPPYYRSLNPYTGLGGGRGLDFTASWDRGALTRKKKGNMAHSGKGVYLELGLPSSTMVRSIWCLPLSSSAVVVGADDPQLTYCKESMVQGKGNVRYKLGRNGLVLIPYRRVQYGTDRQKGLNENEKEKERKERN